MLRREFKLKPRDSLWSADFETDHDWQENVGPLLDRIEASLLTRDALLTKGKLASADRFLHQHIQPNLTRFRRYIQEQRIVVKKSCQASGLRALRADDIFAPDIVINDIWRMINSAGVIIADITTHNANVFYELGIAHTLGKRVILLRQKNGAAPPFDISFWRNFEYELTPRAAEQFEKTLARVLERHRTHPPHAARGKLGEAND